MIITWNVLQLDCYPQQDGLTDVVCTVHWQCNGVEDNYFASNYGTVGVTLDPTAPYTPYDDLTQEQVLGWVWASGVDKNATELAVTQQIDYQKNPPIVTLGLPWVTAVGLSDTQEA
jgi:hypothetical protein